MEKDIKKALSLLQSEGFRCVLCRGDEVITLTQRGVAPLLSLLDTGRDFDGFCAADKVVGRAAAYLYVLLGIKRVHSLILSEAAEEVFSRFEIVSSHDVLVKKILNRTKDGFCPMESAVLNVDDPLEAKEKILAAIEKLKVK